MAQLLGVLLLTFFLTGILLVPFIDLLYKLRFRRRGGLDSKAAVPVGGGGLIIAIVTLITFWSYGLLGVKAKFWELFVLLFTFLSFGILGLYDDIERSFVARDKKFFRLKSRYKLAIQLGIAFISGVIFWKKLGFDFIFVHWLGKVDTGPFFIPLAVLAIVGLAKAFKITDGLDGLSCGSLMICLVAFWVIAASVLDKTLAVFIAVWLGSLIAFLYFNVYPARIWLGDVGALSFGATLAVVGILSGKIVALAVIGGVFVAEGASLALQLLSQKLRGRKLLKAAPLHLYFQDKGWEEPKIVMRFWLAGVMLAIFGLWLAVI